MKQKFAILTNLKNPKALIAALLVAGGIFYANYYAMAHLPGTDGFQCIIGAGFTPFNIVFAMIMSKQAGLVAGALVTLMHERLSARNLQIGSASTVGILLGTLTTFCTLCTLPVLSVFGVGIGLGFITDYDMAFKIVSLALLTVTLFMLNRQLQKACACGIRKTRLTIKD